MKFVQYYSWLNQSLGALTTVRYVFYGIKIYFSFKVLKLSLREDQIKFSRAENSVTM